MPNQIVIMEDVYNLQHAQNWQVLLGQWQTENKKLCFKEKQMNVLIYYNKIVTTVEVPTISIKKA